MSRGAEHLFHLSTRLRPADRRERFRHIRARLAAGEPCQVVSTQLVEAGVDLDFPVVYRTMAPLPSLVQADGRCNPMASARARGAPWCSTWTEARRRLGPTTGLARCTLAVLLDENTFDPWSEDGVREWYRRLLDDGLVPTDAHGVQALRTHLRYRSVSEAFTMIDEDTRSVVIPWPSGDARRGRSR